MRGLALLLLVLPCAVSADSTRATFDIYVSGIRAGMVSISGEERGGRYAAAGRLESVGVIGTFRKVRYDAEVQGRVAGAEFGPQSYAETFRSGDETDRKSITYRRGVPSVEGDDDRDADDLDPSTQGGTIDPLTAIWGILRDVPTGQACRFSAAMFDGARRSSIVLGSPRRASGRITCSGEYRRVAGYSAEDMAKRPRFPFRLTYREAGGGRWQVERIDMDTIFGRGSMVRR
jgi:hypothetical protein